MIFCFKSPLSHDVSWTNRPRWDGSDPIATTAEEKGQGGHSGWGSDWLYVSENSWLSCTRILCCCCSVAKSCLTLHLHGQASLSLIISQSLELSTHFFHFKETRLLLIKENLWKLLKQVILPIFSRFTVSKLKFTLSNSNAQIWSYTQSAKCFMYNESLRVHYPPPSPR